MGKSEDCWTTTTPFSIPRMVNDVCIWVVVELRTSGRLYSLHNIDQLPPFFSCPPELLVETVHTHFGPVPKSAKVSLYHPPSYMTTYLPNHNNLLSICPRSCHLSNWLKYYRFHSSIQMLWNRPVVWICLRINKLRFLLYLFGDSFW